MALLEDGLLAIENGATLITHLFNAMNAFHHRGPGLSLVITTDTFQNKNAYYGIIADGIHIHKEVVKLTYRANPERMCLITDAISALGLEEAHIIVDNKILKSKAQKQFLLERKH